MLEAAAHTGDAQPQEPTGEPSAAFCSSDTLVVKDPIRSWEPSPSWSEQSTCGRGTVSWTDEDDRKDGCWLDGPSGASPGHRSRTSAEER